MTHSSSGPRTWKRARPSPPPLGRRRGRKRDGPPPLAILAVAWVGLFAAVSSPLAFWTVPRPSSLAPRAVTDWRAGRSRRARSPGPATRPRRLWELPMSSSEPNVREPTATSTTIETMSVKDIKAELKERNVSFQDCFDTDSLALRLAEARNGLHSGSNKSSPPQSPRQPNPDEAKPSQSSSTTTPTTPAPADLEAIKRMSVKELRSELASMNVGWKTFVDKDDLVRAVLRSRQEAALFSSTGLLRPGIVGDLTAEQVRNELDSVPTPLLLDVYATWCGPCQMMSPILVQASQEVASVRFAKVDSDRYPELAGSLRVQGLPTLVLFDHGAEVARLEGALMKDQLVAWIRDKLNVS